MFIILTCWKDKKVLVPIGDNAIFEGIDGEHSEYGELYLKHGINTIVRVGVADQVFTMKVTETPFQILHLIHNENARCSKN